MASKGLKDLKQQVEGTGQEGAAAGQPVDPTEAGQKGAEKPQEATDKAANQGSDGAAGKKFSHQK